MDFNKLKDFAKSAAEKTADGIGKANELRKKAGQETKITLPASNSFSGTTTIRKNINGQYYFGLFSETPELYDFAGFDYAGSKVTEKTITKGNTTQQGRAGSALVGGLLGATFNPAGAVVGAIAGGNRKKKGKINTTSTTKIEEKPGKATVKLRNMNTGEIKSISTKLTQAEANNVQMFFLI